MPRIVRVPPSRGRSALTGGRARRRLKELGAFGTVGGFAFLLDIGLFQLLYGHLGVGAVTAKALATLVSMSVAFLGHRNWAFAHRDRTTVRRSFALFALINLCTLALGAAVIWFVRYPLDHESLLIIQAANIASIGLNTALRYVAYRRWVFPPVTGTGSAAGREPGAAGAPPDGTATPSASTGHGDAVPAATGGFA
jgi:putative flippase GtrA